ncbi:unnamed protein product [Prunus armeniaca]
MGISSTLLGSLSILVLVFTVAHGDPLVPALIIFGDSGKLRSLWKRDFVTHRPTGRFSNGKLATDFTTAEYLGFTSYPPAYLSQEAEGVNTLTGVNFASAASGYYDNTARLYGAISLTRQLNNYREYENEVVSMVRRAKANAIFSGAVHLLSAGTSDFIQNYYINPLLRVYSPDQFSDILMISYSTFIQNLYGLGVRRIGVISLPPTGCLPAAITLFGLGRNQCIPRLNQDAISFNNKLNNTSQILKSRLPGLKLVVFDISQPVLDMITNPGDNGFFESRRACCGTGRLETSMLCNSKSVGTCTNATGYVFWDGFHPSEAANKVLAGNLLQQGFDLIS